VPGARAPRRQFRKRIRKQKRVFHAGRQPQVVREVSDWEMRPDGRPKAGNVRVAAMPRRACAGEESAQNVRIWLAKNASWQAHDAEVTDADGEREELGARHSPLRGRSVRLERREAEFGVSFSPGAARICPMQKDSKS